MILGFKKQFEGPILDGTKIHTIREDSHNRWKSGNKIHFATGVRTKKYNQFFNLICISVQPIRLVNHGNHVYCIIQTEEKEYIHNDCIEHDHIKWYSGHLNQKGGLLGDLCKNDGLSLGDFKKWFIPKPDDTFNGTIIHWTDFRYSKETEVKE